MKLQPPKWFTDLPGWAQGVIAIGGVAVGTVVGFKVYKGVKNAVNKSKASGAVRDSKNELADLERSGQKATISDSQFQAWANQLQKQYDGCDTSWFWGSHFPGLDVWFPETFGSYSFKFTAGVLNNLKNDADFLKLVTAFGVRTYDACGWFTGDFTGDLYAAISDELTEEERGILNKILASKNIKYRV